MTETKPGRSRARAPAGGRARCSTARPSLSTASPWARCVSEGVGHDVASSRIARVTLRARGDQMQFSLWRVFLTGVRWVVGPARRGVGPSCQWRCVVVGLDGTEIFCARPAGALQRNVSTRRPRCPSQALPCCMAAWCFVAKVTRGKGEVCLGKMACRTLYSSGGTVPSTMQPMSAGCRAAVLHTCTHTVSH